MKILKQKQTSNVISKCLRDCTIHLELEYISGQNKHISQKFPCGSWQCEPSCLFRKNDFVSNSVSTELHKNVTVQYCCSSTSSQTGSYVASLRLVVEWLLVDL